LAIFAVFLVIADRAECASGDIAASIDREIDALQKELDALGGEENTAAREMDLLSTREALSRRQWQKAVWQRDALARETKAEEKRSLELERAVDVGRVRARSALREAYKGSAAPEYATLFSVAGPGDLLRALQSLDIVARRQSEAVIRYREDLAKSQEAVTRLRAHRAALDVAVADAVRDEDRLRADREARLRLLERLRKDRSLQSQAIAELTRAMSALGASIAALPPDAAPPRVDVAFSRLEGALPWPAAGVVQIPFGSVRNPRFGTETPHPGVDIRVEPAAPVRAVGPGRIVFDRRYGSYGRTVVIDHGGRYLSVYARLAASSVSEGDEVGPGQEIGFADEADANDKSYIYFEIRYQGKALDPADWLRRKGPRGDSGEER